MVFLKKYGFLILKWLIFTASIFYLINRIFLQSDSTDIFIDIKFSASTVFILLSVIFLMFINWGLEAFKWKLSVRSISSITFKKAFASILAGTSVSLFMPNRTGEFVGRIFALPKEKRAEGTIASIVISFAQLNITLLTGFSAICYYFFFYPKNVFTQNEFTFLIIIPLAIITLFGLLLYMKIKWLEKLFHILPFLKKYTEKAKLLSTYSFTDLCMYLFISFLRYLVFLIQFQLLIILFGIEISFLESILSIILTFYVATVIPSFSFSEIGTRGSVAVLFFGFFSPSSAIEIISASTLLWIINVGTPALIGNYFVARFKENP